ncbi:11199_t:CDS:10 [Ambispora leptoticha]|uniref:11199_t:CDS:1 n=1 Tax=Ambispora leptoticha TaxID=144679 RepID=A0A9N8WIA8_9GLOM|nr:11199_t:CDS:10 [Ambispora leptoticha]
MNDLIELREKVKITVDSNHNDESHSSTKYTALPSSSSAIDITTSKKINPPRWNTLEFYFYYLVFAICVPMMFKIAIDLSKDSHPNYPLYAKRLQKGWIFGRKVDNSDAQFASLRDNYPVLAIALVGYLILSHIYRLFFIPRAPIKQPSQHLGRAYFFLGFALIFKGSKINIVLTWMFNLVVIFCNDHYNGYAFSMIDERLAFLDKNQGQMKRWFITFNICMLRMVSYNMDYYWSFHHNNVGLNERNDRDHAPLTIKDRIKHSCFPGDYNYVYYLSYILYTPLYMAGPILTYNDYISQLRYPHKINIKATFLYGIRLIAAVLGMELMLHYIYVVAISQSRAWIGDTPAQLSMIGYFNLKLIWLKLLIIWRFFRFWAMADGMEVAENMTRCMSNNYSAQGFWRSWHRSFNLWNIRYIYIPLGGSKRQILNILIVFTFVALWHDISLRLLAWSWLIWLFILPESFAQKIFLIKKWDKTPYYRHICAAGGVFNILMMMIANLVGFSVGLDGLKDLLTQIFLTIHALFVGVQIMFEIREEEARKNINTKG